MRLAIVKLFITICPRPYKRLIEMLIVTFIYHEYIRIIYKTVNTIYDLKTLRFIEEVFECLFIFFYIGGSQNVFLVFTE